MTITRKMDGTTLEIAVEGKLDTMTSPELSEEIEKGLLDGAEYLLWDFSKLEEEIAALEIEGVDLSGLNFDVLIGGGNPIPDNLDADEGYNSSAPIAGKFTFNNYVEYAQHEQELKDFAEEIGAEFSVVKA